MKEYLSIGMILLLLFLPACSKQEVEITKSHRIYYVNSEETKLMSEGYDAQGETCEELVSELLARLATPAENVMYRCPLGGEIQVIDYVLEDANQLTLYFEDGYSSLTGVSEALVRAAIVKTLCQIPEVYYVAFYVNGQPLMKTAEQPVGWMNASDFINNTGAETGFAQTAYLTVYYANIQGDRLKESHLKVEYKGYMTQEQLVLERLIDGPLEEMSAVQATLPEDTVINQVTTKDGICYVDFNGAFLNKPASVTEEVVIYSVVNSLTELTNVMQVQISVDGELRKVYLSQPINTILERKLELIEE